MLAGSSASFDDVPDVAVDTSDGRLLGVGQGVRALRSPRVLIGNGFNSPRSIIGDVDLAEIALRHAMEEVLNSYRQRLWHPLLQQRPDLVLHPLVMPEDGLTSFEVQGLRDLGRRLGGRRVYVHAGPELSERELVSGGFS